jgi:HK97 family phage portal protein
LGLADNIRDFFSQQNNRVETKSYNNFPTSQVVFPYNTEIGYFSGTNQMSPEGNSAALACLNVLGTAFSEPPIEVYQNSPEGSEKILNHPASTLLKAPSPYLSGNLLNQYIISSISVSGDAFIMKLRNESGGVVQLYPLIPENVEVKGNQEELITHYEYKQKGQNLYVKREDMIHLREKIDPRNHRRGLAPLRSVMVEVLGDSAASQMAAALVKNTGVPSVVISPKNDLSMTTEEADTIADVFGRRFGGENRGRPLVISGGEVDIQTLSFSPKDLEIGKLRYINEERISAVLGVPAILAGLGSGLERSTYSNTSELREFFTEQKLIPMWKNVASDLTNQLLKVDFEDDPSYEMKYDLSDVRALAQDELQEMDKVVRGLQAGFITVAEARKATGFVSDDPNMDVYLRALTQVEVPADGSEPRVFQGQVPVGEPTIDDPQTAPLKSGGKDEEQVEAYVILADGERVHVSWLEDKKIKKEGGKYCVYSKDGKRKFGCYATRKEAERRLRQIERYKAAFGDLSVGDSVSWSIPKDPDPPSTSHGIIMSLNSMEETARIKVYAILEDGSHEVTDRVVELEVSRLRKIKDILDENKQLSDRVEKALKNKMEEHNADNPKYRATMSMLRKVFERGVGAYRNNPSSVRGNVRSADQWAMARVNAFLKALKTGKFPRTPFDRDLLPDDHPDASDEKYGKPKKPKKKPKKPKKPSRYKQVEDVPDYIQKNAQRGLDLLEFAGAGLTDRTKREARLMANGEISDNKVIRMAAWFARHESDLDSPDADDYLSGESEKPTAGQVAWLLWGGDIDNSNKMRAMEWAEKEVEKLEQKSISYEFYGWEDPTVKLLGLPPVKWYKTEEEKSIYWKNIDDLRKRWEDLFSNIYAKELNRQRREIVKAVKSSSDIATLETNTDKVIDATEFERELLPFFYSLSDDFSVRAYDNLFPKAERPKAADPVDLGVTIPEEDAVRTVFDEVALLLPAARPLKKVVEDGFYRGQRNVPAAVGSLFQDGQAASFLQENARSVMKDLNKTTKKRISTIVGNKLKEFEKLGITNITAGTEAGDKFFRELTRAINKELGGQSLRRAKAIARTEVGKASSWAQQRAAKSTGKRLEKEWVSQRDGLVRDAHFILDNQRVPLNSFYLYNGIKLDRPLDPKAPAGLVVNCRCTEAFIEVIDE